MNLQEIEMALGNGHLDRVKTGLGERKDAFAVRTALKITDRLLREMNQGGKIVVVKPDGSTRELYLKRGAE